MPQIAKKDALADAIEPSLQFTEKARYLPSKTEKMLHGFTDLFWDQDHELERVIKGASVALQNLKELQSKTTDENELGAIKRAITRYKNLGRQTINLRTQITAVKNKLETDMKVIDKSVDDYVKFFGFDKET
jgi:hypothetical protein